MFPIKGRPLGPGGYGNLNLLGECRDLRYFASAMREMVVARGIAKEESVFASSSMVKGAGEKRG